MHLGWRARDEPRKVLLGDLEIRQEEGGERREYIIWKTERGSKTRSGGKEFRAERYFSPSIYSTGGDRCPVNIFQTFLARRPPDMMKPDSPLYLAVVKSPKSEVWYKRQPLGVHSLGQFMKTMADAVSLTGKHTNHSARRTMITALRHENVNPLDISQLLGYKNLKSIDSYSRNVVENKQPLRCSPSAKSAEFEQLCSEFYGHRNNCKYCMWKSSILRSSFQQLYHCHWRKISTASFQAKKNRNPRGR